MSADESRGGLLRTHRWTIVTILFVSLLVVLLLVGAVTVIGIVGTDDTDTNPELPAAHLTITEGNATITDHEGPSNRTVVEITYRSGTDVLQGQVAVRVNEQTAWDVRQNDEGDNVSVSVWDEPSTSISDESARVVVYGAELDERDLQREDVSDRYSYLEEGDVIEIVWYGDGGETMTVLQRYEVGQEE